jgi:hypothetical protein
MKISKKLKENKKNKIPDFVKNMVGNKDFQKQFITNTKIRGLK